MMQEGPAVVVSQAVPSLSSAVLPPLETGLDAERVMRALARELLDLEDLLRRDFIAAKKIELKEDSSLVTEADKAIEKLLTESLPKILPGSSVLGEEAAPKTRQEAEKAISADLLWVVDPIDGTTNFAFGLPLFAISVGLMKREPEGLRPVLGALLLAGSSQLISTDGATVTRRCLRTGSESAIDGSLNGPASHTPMLCSGVPAEASPLARDQSRYRFLGTTALDIAFCAMGSGIGTVTKASIWDFAGALPIALAAGLEMRSLAGGELKTHFGIEDFEIADGGSWGLKQAYVLCRPEHRQEVSLLLGYDGGVQ